MQIYEALKSDHERVKKILDAIEETTERAVKTRADLLIELKNELLAHAKAEEAVFYSQIEPSEETHELALEGYEEHKLVEDVLASLEVMDPSDETWLAKFKVLKENVEHHIREEESEMFKKARQIVSREDAEDMSEEFQEMKEEVIEELNLH